MRIGELAGHTGYTVEAIRHYEHAGLLPKPARTASNYRHYGAQHLERLQFIRHCRSLDMALDEIRTLLSVRDAPDQRCGAVNAMLDQHITQVGQRIAELHALEQQLKNIRALCGQDLAARDCAILHCLGGVAELGVDANAPTRRLLFEQGGEAANEAVQPERRQHPH